MLCAVSKVLGRSWSAPFNLTSSNKGELYASGCALSVRIQNLAGMFHRTRSVTLLPRFIVISNLMYDIYMYPFSSNSPVVSTAINRRQLVKAGSSCTVYQFPQYDLHHEAGIGAPYIYVEAKDGPLQKGTNEKCPICANKVGEQHIWVITTIHGRRRIIVAAVKSQGTVFSITLAEATTFYPYRVENKSRAPASFRQYAAGTDWVELEPMSWKAFIWTKPFMDDKRIEIVIPGYEGNKVLINLNQVGRAGTISWASTDKFGEAGRYRWEGEVPQSGRLGFDIRVDVSTRVLTVYEIGDYESMSKTVDPTSYRPLNSLSPSSKQAANWLHLESVNFTMTVAGVYARIIDDEDLVGISIDKLLCRLVGEKQMFELSIFHYQVDDLFPKAKFPVAFFPSSSGRNSHLQRGIVRAANFARITCNWLPSAGSIVHLNYLDISLGEATAKISMDFLMRLIAVIGKTFILINSAVDETMFLHANEIDTLRQALRFNIAERIFNEISSLSNIYFCLHHFRHSDLIIHLEVFIGSKSGTYLDFNTMDKTMISGFAVVGGPMVSFLSSLVGSIAHVSPVFNFKAFAVTDFFGNAQNFAHMLYTVLNQQAFAQAYKLFGSLELIGNPLSFIDNISTGVSDFYSETLDEVEGNSSMRGKGLKRLAVSVVTGTFGTASRVTG